MSTVLKISEASVLALHAAAYLASRKGETTSLGEIAGVMKASENHLSKVMQRLARAGIVKSIRGPKGGFELARRAKSVTLLQIYEIVEGPLSNERCLLSLPACDCSKCIMGDLVRDVHDKFKDYMSHTTLAELAGLFCDRISEKARK